MAKRSRKRRFAPKIASSEPEFHPDATLGPDASLESTVQAWRERESTNAPIVGEEEPEQSYAAGYPALVEKLLQAKVPLSGRTILVLLILGWFAFISWLFLQDNQAGMLATINGLKWFGVKASLYSAIAVICAGIIFLVLKLTSTKQGRLTSR